MNGRSDLNSDFRFGFSMVENHLFESFSLQNQGKPDWSLRLEVIHEKPFPTGWLRHTNLDITFERKVGFQFCFQFSKGIDHAEFDFTIRFTKKFSDKIIFLLYL